MRLAKSIFNPGRAARLFRRNKRGSTLETHEPSSPKVTCIGQVRVKSKKKSRHCRSLSKRRNLGEVSFRKGVDRHHQKWVHLPISLVKAFGADISCCCNCKSCCFSSKTKCCRCGCGCGDVFARLLVCVSCNCNCKCICGGEKKAIEEVVSVRRHAFDDIEVKDGRIEVNGERLDEEVGRLGICIPPKNALLLMRCRSDPMKMAALVNRITWATSNPLEIEEPEPEPGESQSQEQEMSEQEEEEEVESNMSSFEALLSQQEQPPPVQQQQSETNTKNDEEIMQEEEEEEEEEEGFDKIEETEEESGKEDENVLPDCLVLMMREPKLSMEVSKETWVHGADFIKWLPPRKPPNKPAKCHHELVRKRPNPKPLPKKTDHQPPRSSCSLPNAATPHTMLTRCKSVPMRTPPPDPSTGIS